MDVSNVLFDTYFILFGKQHIGATDQSIGNVNASPEERLVCEVNQTLQFSDTDFGSKSTSPRI